MSDKPKLTPKREAFARAYVETGNGSEAYRRSYSTANMKPETVTENASRLLADGNVSARVAELQAAMAERNNLKEDDIIRHLLAVMNTTMTDVVTWDEDRFAFIPSDDLPEFVRPAIQSLKVKRKRLVTGNPRDPEEWEVEEREVRLKDSLKAADMLGKLLGMWVNRHEHTGRNGGPIEVTADGFDHDAYARLFQQHYNPVGDATGVAEEDSSGESVDSSDANA